MLSLYIEREIFSEKNNYAIIKEAVKRTRTFNVLNFIFLKLPLLYYLLQT